MTTNNQGIGIILEETYVILLDPDKLALFEAKDNFLHGAVQQSKNAEFKNFVKEHTSGCAAYLEIVSTWTQGIIADLALEVARNHLRQLSLATWNGMTEQFLTHWETSVANCNNLAVTPDQMYSSTIL